MSVFLPRRVYVYHSVTQTILKNSGSCILGALLVVGACLVGELLDLRWQDMGYMRLSCSDIDEELAAFYMI